MTGIPIPPCELGRHRAGRRWRDENDTYERSRCIDCKHMILRSLATRRWIISTYLA